MCNPNKIMLITSRASSVISKALSSNVAVNFNIRYFAKGVLAWVKNLLMVHVPVTWRIEQLAVATAINYVRNASATRCIPSSICSSLIAV